MIGIKGASARNRNIVSGFAPTDIFGLQIWLDAQDASSYTIDGSNRCSSWRSKFGTLANFTNVTAVNQPILTSSGIGTGDAFNFDSAKALESDFTTVFAGRNRTFICTFKVTSAVSSLRYLAIGDSNNEFFALNTSERFQTRYRNAANTTTIQRLTGSNSIPINTDLIISLRFFTNVGNTEDNCVIRINGIEVSNFSGVSGIFEGPYNGTLTKLGAVTTAGASNLQGLIGEICYYSNDIGDVNSIQVENYLASKWGISI